MGGGYDEIWKTQYKSFELKKRQDQQHREKRQNGNLCKNESQDELIKKAGPNIVQNIKGRTEIYTINKISGLIFRPTSLPLLSLKFKW